MPQIKNIAIIGAGSAGLIAAYELKNAGLKFTIFEQRDCVGGIWAIQPLSKIPDARDNLNGIFSPTYPSLRCNLPKCCMDLPGLPFPKKAREFPDHTEVLTHIKQFAQQHKLQPYISFNHQFQGVELIRNPVHSGKKWRCITQPENNLLFDGVILCTSRFGCPVIPGSIKNLDQFMGKLEHSLSYREPSPYKNKRVALLGTGPSGEDLSREISQSANRVFVCAHHGSRTFLLPEKGFYGARKNISRHGNVVACYDKNLILENGHSLENIDIFILCTGYKPSNKMISAFPKISSLSYKENNNNFYLSIFHPEYPELSAMGLQAAVAPFILYPYQAKAIQQQLQGVLKLPTTTQMIFAAKYTHLSLMGRNNFSERIQLGKQYLHQLSVLTRSQTFPTQSFKAFDKTKLHRHSYPETYRDQPFG